MYTLKELRARKNWTQEETAQRLGVTVQTYNAWEHDFGRVRASSAVAVAKLFDVKLDDIWFPAYRCASESGQSLERNSTDAASDASAPKK